MRRALLVLTILLGSAVFPAFAQPSGSTTADLVLVGGTIYINPTEAPITNRRDRNPGRKDRGGRNPRASSNSSEYSNARLFGPHDHRQAFGTVTCTSSKESGPTRRPSPPPELTRQLQDMLTRFGYTSAFDLGSSWENTRRIPRPHRVWRSDRPSNSFDRRRARAEERRSSSRRRAQPLGGHETRAVRDRERRGSRDCREESPERGCRRDQAVRIFATRHRHCRMAPLQPP
jgi:hypothetical protein